MLIVLVHQYLSEKHKPIFAILNQLKGVLGSDTIPKHGGDNENKEETHKEEPKQKKKIDEHQEQKPKVAQKGNEVFGSKVKEKNFIDDDYEELPEGGKLVRKKRDKELDHLLILQREFEEKRLKLK
ncbi:unnamed protein product [Lactuca saligna]|uniref:Uncharacterized protein n=1 Tax=Lactuca saligna TaxID=75948 RepID=A0AA36E800_LACSI|nr:unnamed protein product [Lactuca saligna]